MAEMTGEYKLVINSAQVDGAIERLEKLEQIALRLKAMGISVEAHEQGNLTDLSDEDLLREIIRRNPVGQGPTKSEYDRTIRETTIGIGNDHMATIRLHKDDVAELKARG